MADLQPRVLFYFLHLLGVGHVYRAKRLIAGLVARGIGVDVIYGGEPIPGLSLKAESVTFLPPIRAVDPAFSGYVDGEGNPLGEAWMAKRKAVMLEAFASLRPDLILTEAFPFGRRMVRHEVGALLEAASARAFPPLVACSVRDILQERKAGRAEETRDWIAKHYDHVLVHSDPDIIPLEATYPQAAEIAGKTHYTGFVIPPRDDDAEDIGTFDTIVSVGGGAFGAGLAQVALEAANRRDDRTWCIATGPNMDAATADALRAAAEPHVTIVSRLDNLAAHLARASVSISQCGYNTAMDALFAHGAGACRAVFVPYDTEGQSEQLRRAQLLEKAGYAINLPQSLLTVERLLDAHGRAQQLAKVEARIDFDGVAETARLIGGWIQARGSRDG